MPGDRGFDPLGLAKPTEYLQVSTTPAAACAPEPQVLHASASRTMLCIGPYVSLAAHALTLLRAETAMCRLTWMPSTRTLP